MRKFVQSVSIEVPTYLQWVDLANKMILLDYRAFCEVQDYNFPWIMYTDLRDDSPPYFSIMSDIYEEWSDKRMYSIKEWNPDLYLALAGMSEGPEFWPGEWVVDKSTSTMFGKCIESGSDKVNIKNLVSTEISIPKLWIRKATKEEIIEHFTKSERDKALNKSHNALIAPYNGTTQRFTIDQAKDIIAKALSIPVEQVEIDGR